MLKQLRRSLPAPRRRREWREWMLAAPPQRPASRAVLPNPAGATDVHSRTRVGLLAEVYLPCLYEVQQHHHRRSPMHSRGRSSASVDLDRSRLQVHLATTGRGIRSPRLLRSCRRAACAGARGAPMAVAARRIRPCGGRRAPRKQAQGPSPSRPRASHRERRCGSPQMTSGASRNASPLGAQATRQRERCSPPGTQHRG